MTDTSQLAELRIREYESRLRHVDELIGKAKKKLESHPERERQAPALTAVIAQRDRLAQNLEALRLKDPKNLDEEIEKAGPMGVWDALAAQLEKLVERLGL